MSEPEGPRGERAAATVVQPEGSQGEAARPAERRPPSWEERAQRGPGDELDVVRLERLNVTERMRVGAESGGVRLLHYRDRFPVPGTKAERRAERGVAFCFLLTFVAAVGFIVVYLAVPWQYHLGNDTSAWFTPLLGVTLGLALAGVGVGAVLWAKWLMPEEEAVEERHDGFSSEVDRTLAAATLIEGFNGTGLARRSLLRRSLGLGAGALGLLAIVPLGGLIKKPRGELNHTLWAKGVRLVSYEGTPVQPGDMEAGALQTVFPGVPGGKTAAESPVMLIRLHPGTPVSPRPGQEDFHWQDYFAFSKICTHAGCPVSLYEQQTNRILCPCHQSQFDITKDCTPVFGPAARPLPQLAITVDADGYFAAKGDFVEPVGPSFWERP